MEVEVEKYDSDELKFIQEFKTDFLSGIDSEGLKRIYSLEFRIPDNIILECYNKLKEKCESDESESVLKEWLGDNEIINHLSFRHKNNSVFWRKDKYIIILYGENLSKKTYSERHNSNDSFSLFWNFEKLKPIIKSFLEYANNYISDQCILGRIEFVNMGDKVNITYFG
jgi:hypothetical protein